MILVCPNCSSRFKVKPEAIGDAGRMVRCAKCGNKWHAGPEDLIDPEDLKSLSAATKTGKKAAAKKVPARKAAPAMAEEQAAPPPPLPDEPEEEDFPEPAEDDGRSAEDDDLGAPPPPPPMMDGSEPPPFPSEADFNPRSTVPMRRKSPLAAWIGLFVIVLLTAAGAYSFQKQIVSVYPPAMKIYHTVGIDVDLLGHGLELAEPEAEAVVDGDKRRLVVKGTVTNTTDETVNIPKLAGVLKDATGTVLHEWVFGAEKPEAFPGESIAYETVVESPPRGATSLEVTFKTEEEAMMIMEGGEATKEGEAMKEGDAMKESEGESATGSQ